MAILLWGGDPDCANAYALEFASMICEMCGASVPMLQRRLDLDHMVLMWVCMSCAPDLEPHLGGPMKELSEEQMAEIREIGLEAWKEQRALEKKDLKKRNAHEMRKLRREGKPVI